MTADDYRAMALSFPEAVESSHMGTADFRMRGKIFATLRETDGRAVLKLAADQQALLMETAGSTFAAVSGGWGLKGWTLVRLDQADEATVRRAMELAWRSVAPKSFLKSQLLR